jgi:hypothetical protein
MSVWYCIPSARPPEQAEPVLRSWIERGYKLAIWRDNDLIVCEDVSIKKLGAYPGYAAAVNALVRAVLIADQSAEWLVTGGDDIYPDANLTAEQIAEQCSEHFYNNVELAYPASRPAWSDIPLPSFGGSGKDAPSFKRWSTFGVMQPTGDRWGDDRGPYIERVAGSPWMGREFCLRMYQGNGPLCEGYFHMGEDEELQAVASKLGAFWQRPDVIHYHNHWGRVRGDVADRPAFLDRANSAVEWQKYRQLFAARQAAGFPGHEPLA